jgi:hypothetical protein
LFILALAFWIVPPLNPLCSPFCFDNVSVTMATDDSTPTGNTGQDKEMEQGNLSAQRTEPRLSPAAESMTSDATREITVQAAKADAQPASAAVDPNSNENPETDAAGLSADEHISAEKEKKPNFLQKIWAKTGLDIFTVLLMMKYDSWD